LPFFRKKYRGAETLFLLWVLLFSVVFVMEKRGEFVVF